MADKPDTAAPTKPRRRWFQFSLRTLLILVAMLAVPCAYVAHAAKVVADRRAWLDAHPWNLSRTVGVIYEIGDQGKRPGTIRRWLGDEPQDLITVVDPVEGDFLAASELFPEANIFLWRSH